MKILTLSHELPPIGGGGGQAAYDIAAQLVKLGHTVTILTDHYGELPRVETIHGIKIVRVGSLRREMYRASFLTLAGYIFFGLVAGLRLILKDKPDLIHAHFAVPSGALAYLLSRLSGVPYALTVHLGDVPGGVPEKTDRWFRWIKAFTPPIWGRAKAVVAVSEYTRQLALKTYAVDVKVIPNGIDLSQFAPAPLELNHPAQIVFAGRFMPQKNPLAIVRTLARLKQLNWECAMLGDGPLYEEVKREVEHFGMSERFDLPGWVRTEDVLAAFSKSDILFMPSLSEGLPVVGVQALAKGLAFVVSDIGGFADLVQRNGFLVERTDTAGFVRALEQLLSNPELILQFRQASLEHAKNFEIETVARQYDQIFSVVTSRLKP
ncbi:MAG: glycosyltransferase family 4 protein [Anaerolineales bacterium]|nr:glycosyltransferase family 4 protein [Anaerolineales bacterium]